VMRVDASWRLPCSVGLPLEIPFPLQKFTEQVTI
jgi:hypothetical protein